MSKYCHNKNLRFPYFKVINFRNFWWGETHIRRALTLHVSEGSSIKRLLNKVRELSVLLQRNCCFWGRSFVNKFLHLSELARYFSDLNENYLGFLFSIIVTLLEAFSINKFEIFSDPFWQFISSIGAVFRYYKDGCSVANLAFDAKYRWNMRARTAQANPNMYLRLRTKALTAYIRIHWPWCGIF